MAHFTTSPVISGEPTGRVVVGAHYDTAFGLPGADDNASGVAALLEIARALAKHPPEGRVDVVAYCLEEPPFFGTDAMGSYAHARGLHDQGVAIKAALVLETLGYYDDAPGSQHFPHRALSAFYPTAGDFVAVLGRFGDGALAARVRDAMRAQGGIDVYSMNGPVALAGIDWSDHRSYWEWGAPALMITDTAPAEHPAWVVFRPL